MTASRYLPVSVSALPYMVHARHQTDMLKERVGREGGFLTTAVWESPEILSKPEEAGFHPAVPRDSDWRSLGWAFRICKFRIFNELLQSPAAQGAGPNCLTNLKVPGNCLGILKGTFCFSGPGLGLKILISFFFCCFCVCTCVWVCTDLCAHMWACMELLRYYTHDSFCASCVLVCGYAWAYVYMCGYAWISMHMCVCMWIHVSWIHMCACIYVHMSVDMCMCTVWVCVRTRSHECGCWRLVSGGFLHSPPLHLLKQGLSINLYLLIWLFSKPNLLQGSLGSTLHTHPAGHLNSGPLPQAASALAMETSPQSWHSALLRSS